MKFLARAIATVLGAGYSPFAPGTAGTAVGCAAAWALVSLPWAYAAVLAAAIAAGIWAGTVVEKLEGKTDTGCVVVDEFAGVMLGLAGIPLTWPTVITGFFLFRAFDMFKIYPINRFERLPGGWGIMMDDLMAGLYTNLVLQLALRFARV